jgi:CubicO group peptidase (beta-lactamase class C family)
MRRIEVVPFFAGALLMAHAALAADSKPGPAPAPPLKGDPVAAGLDPAKLAGLHAQLQKFVTDHQIAGAVTVIGRRARAGDVIGDVQVVGFRDLESHAPMQPDTIFRIASMTKVATSVGVMMLEDEGKLSVDDPVEKYLPEFRGQKLMQSQIGSSFMLVDPPRLITVKDLLTHTSGMQCEFPPGFADVPGKRNRPLAEAVAGYSQHPLEAPPGTRWKYCGPPWDTLGRIVEVAAKQPFDVYMEEHVFRPLGMKDTTFNPTPAQRERLAVLYKKEGDGLARSDGKTGPGQPVRYFSPSGGLYSTAGDYARLLQMLLDRGTFGDRRLLREATFDKMTRIHFEQGRTGFTPGLGMGLGVLVVDRPEDVTSMLLPGAFGHGGAFGTQAWVDPKHEMYFVLMIQRQGFGNGDMSDVRKALQAAGVDAILPVQSRAR